MQDNGSPALSTNCFLNVIIEDENDNDPSFDYTQEYYKINMLRSVATNRRVYRVYATDADEGPNGRVSYRLTAMTPACPNCFSINSGTGWITRGRGALQVSKVCNNCCSCRLTRVWGHECEWLNVHIKFGKFTLSDTEVIAIFIIPNFYYSSIAAVSILDCYFQYTWPPTKCPLKFCVNWAYSLKDISYFKHLALRPIIGNFVRFRSINVTAHHWDPQKALPCQKTYNVSHIQ